MLRLAQCNAAESTNQVMQLEFLHALEGRLKEFFLAVAKTVLSATMKYAAPATVEIMRA